jgi:hypothetical protein
MATTLTHTQVRSVQAGPLYRVSDTATAGVNIEKEVFVFKTADDVFNRIATVADMTDYPNTKAQAVLDGKDYYRDAHFQHDYASLKQAADAATAIVGRLKALLVDYDAATNTFVGTTTETLSS